MSITVSNGEISHYWVRCVSRYVENAWMILIYLFFVNRGGMIQTHEQYEFIHQALCEYEKDLAEPVSNCQPHHWPCPGWMQHWMILLVRGRLCWIGSTQLYQQYAIILEVRYYTQECGRVGGCLMSEPTCWHFSIEWLCMEGWMLPILSYVLVDQYV